MLSEGVCFFRSFGDKWYLSPLSLGFFCGAADLSCMQQGLGGKALHPPSPVWFLQQLSTLCSLLSSCSPQTEHDRGMDVSAPSPQWPWDNVSSSISCSQVWNSSSLWKLPFYPCWGLAAGRICCEDHPQDPVGISDPEIISVGGQLERRKRMVLAPKRCWDPGSGRWAAPESSSGNNALQTRGLVWVCYEKLPFTAFIAVQLENML